MYDPMNTQLLDLLMSGKRVLFERNQNIQFSQERMTVVHIKKGYVKRYILGTDGVESMQVVYGPGDILPLTPVFTLIFDLKINEGNETTYYRAITDVELYAVNSDDLLSALNTNPMMYKDLLFVAGVRLASNIHRLDNVSFKVANRRVIHELIYLAEHFGKQFEGGILVQVPLTHDDIASLLNMARVTVSICMARLREKNLIDSDRKIIILDLEGLKKEII